MVKKWKQYLKDESGVSLIVAIMTLFVLSIIGVTLATVTFANVKLSTTDREHQSTYYIAEAGVNQAYAEIRDEVLKIYDEASSDVEFYSNIESTLLGDVMFKAPFKKFKRSFGERPEANITVSKIEDGNLGEYLITSEGIIGKRKRTVTKNFSVNWVPKGGPTPMPELPEGVGAIVKNNVNVHQINSVNGDIYLDSDLEDSFSIGQTDTGINGDLYLTLPNEEEERQGEIDKILNYESGTEPSVKNMGFTFNWDKLYQYFDNFPEVPSYLLHEDVTINSEDGNHQHDVIKDGHIHMDHWLLSDGFHTLNLNDNYYFKKATFNNRATLKIDLGDDDRELVFDKLYLTNGNIEIIGTGRLTIYVKEELIFSSGANVNVDGDINQLTLQYDGDDTVNFSNVNMNANILVKDADVTLNSADVRIGMFMSGGGSVKMNG